MSSSSGSASPPPTAALAGAAAPPSTATWPDEIWCLILDHLDYEGLHKASRLCKKLKRFIEDESFDTRLFRKRVKPPKKLVPNSKLEIHPLLQATYCVFTGKDALTWASMGRDDDEEEHTAFEYPAVDEYATMPPCTIMHVDVGVGKTFPVTDRNGIKVRRVLQRVGHFWGSKPSSGAYGIAAEYGCRPDEVTMSMCLGDHNGWTSWRDAKVENEGTAVKLRAGGYDS
ncbi:hypothetical protein JCM9279_007608 [Rhodotorula babjevae]